jgi:hypothetical protein
MGYETQDVRIKFDGMGTRICAYAQPKGICTGVCMEWIRRILVKRQAGLYPKAKQGDVTA